MSLLDTISAWIDRREVRSLRDLNDKLLERIETLENAYAASERNRIAWMKDAVDLDFEARVAKGCYTKCPVGRITVNQELSK